MDMTSPRARRRLRAQARRHAVMIFLETILFSAIAILIMCLISQAVLQTYEDTAAAADAIEARRVAEEARGWEAEEQPEDGRSPLYIEHLRGQDRAWQAEGEPDGE